MSDGTKVEWADATWNPISGCTPVSEACRNCYASRMIGRNLPKMGHAGPFSRVQFHPDRIDQPLRWRKPRRIFLGSMTDIFHEQVPDEWIDKVMAVIALAPQHTYMILSKRPERMREYFSSARNITVQNVVDDMETWDAEFVPQESHAPWIVEWPLPNLMLGVTAENQEMADQRIPILLQTPAAKRFVSVEPMLGAVDLRRHLFGAQAKKVLLDAGGSLEGLPYHLVPPPSIDWVICGGESGPGARFMHPHWVENLRDQCMEAGVPFFFKGWGTKIMKKSDPNYLKIDGREWKEVPG